MSDSQKTAVSLMLLPVAAGVVYGIWRLAQIAAVYLWDSVLHLAGLCLLVWCGVMLWRHFKSVG